MDGKHPAPDTAVRGSVPVTGRMTNSVPTVPTFYPTEEEFALGPLAYIERIAGKASETGIAHIVPPGSWDPPPLALRVGIDGIDEDGFEFGVRIQPTSKLFRRRPNGEAEFGFARADRKYTLGEFEARCREFDEGQFGGRANPSVEEVEGAFWRIVNAGEEGGVEGGEEGGVCAEYGSDLDNLENGSGFPMPDGLRAALFERRCVQARCRVPKGGRRASWENYRSHSWNVNLFSLHPRSALSYLVDEGAGPDGVELVSGVMVPWVYVGSTFAAFAWHVEDHALFSVNYLHEGAPKVWYCVPPNQSGLFEEAMRELLPELFQASPDLLLKLVTMADPRHLQARGVEVHRVVHTPGSFVVTMPNVYHSGLNTGFNVAESCNFGALPWLRFSKDALKRYAHLRPVSISHDEVMVRIIERCKEPDMIHAAKCELRMRLSEIGDVWKAVEERAASVRRQEPATDEADCAVCACDLWLAGCFEEGNPTEMVCLTHAATLAADREMLMTFRYTLDELTRLCD
jgi:hypothetical protein